MSSADPVRLNILALPSRTTVLFVLIILVVMLPIVAAFGEGSPISAPFLLFWMIVLPLYRFLAQPDRLVRQYGMTDAGQRYPALAQRWAELACRAGIRLPRLKVTDAGLIAAGFGTPRRPYCALGQQAAADLESELRPGPGASSEHADSILLHELAHFIHHDVSMAYAAHSLLRAAVPFLLLSLIVNLLSPWLYTSIIAFIDFKHTLPPDVFQMLEAIDPTVAKAVADPPVVAAYVWVNWLMFVLTAHWPLILGCGVLLWFFWPALMRTRELYADARVALTQTNAQFLSDQLNASGHDFFTYAPPHGRLLWLQRQIHELWLTCAVRFGTWPLRILKRLRDWHDVRPDPETRRLCLDEPDQIHGSDAAIGATAGVAVVLINLTLGSLFLSRYVRGPNSSVPFLIGFVVLSLSLLPSLCQFPQDHPAYSRRVWRTVLYFSAIKLVPQLTLALVLTAGVLAEPGLIDRAVQPLIPGVPPNLITGTRPDFVIEVYAIRPAILFMIGMPLILLLGLQLDAHLKRRVLRWYGAPLVSTRPGWALGGITAWIALGLALIVVPILDAVTVPTAHDLFDPGTLSGLGAGALLIILGLALYSVLDRRYADRCPQCGTKAQGEIRPGQSCQACHTVFHSHLYLTSQSREAVRSKTEDNR